MISFLVFKATSRRFSGVGAIAGNPGLYAEIVAPVMAYL